MALFKTLALFSSVCVYIIIGIILHFLTCFFSNVMRWKILSLWTNTFCRFFISLFNINVVIEGDRSAFKEKGNFIVSNHLSYLDGVVLGSLMPLVHVSKSQVMSWPLFGWMARIGGTIFIDRKKPLNSDKYVGDIANMLKKNVNVLVFPEGTSTSGENILPFQSVFFEVPRICDSYILPLAIYYTKVDNEEISVYNRDKVLWYGQSKFAKHILQLARLEYIEVKVVVHPRLKPTSFGSDSLNRKRLSESLRGIILRDYLAIKK